MKSGVKSGVKPGVKPGVKSGRFLNEADWGKEIGGIAGISVHLRRFKEEGGIMSEVWDRAWSHVLRQIDNQVWDRVWDQVRSQVEDQTWHQIGNSVYSQTEFLSLKN